MESDKHPVLFYKKKRVPVEFISKTDDGKYLVTGPEHAIVDEKEEFVKVDN